MSSRRSTNLTIKSKSSLNTNKKSFDSESFKHNFCHLFPVLRCIEGGLGENETMFLWFASQMWINRFMPKLFNSLPIFDLAWFKQITNLMTFWLFHSLISNIIIHFRTFKFCIFLLIILSLKIYLLYLNWSLLLMGWYNLDPDFLHNPFLCTLFHYQLLL